KFCFIREFLRRYALSERSIHNLMLNHFTATSSRPGRDQSTFIVDRSKERECKEYIKQSGRMFRRIRHYLRRCRTLKTSIMFSTKITEVVLSLRILAIAHDGNRRSTIYPCISISLPV
ncbi:hypothetical protein L9F63_002497, partial [Diploptera punctata]